MSLQIYKSVTLKEIKFCDYSHKAISLLSKSQKFSVGNKIHTTWTVWCSYWVEDSSCKGPSNGLLWGQWSHILVFALLLLHIPWFSVNTKSGWCSWLGCIICDFSLTELHWDHSSLGYFISTSIFSYIFHHTFFFQNVSIKTWVYDLCEDL